MKPKMKSIIWYLVYLRFYAVCKIRPFYFVGNLFPCFFLPSSLLSFFLSFYLPLFLSFPLFLLWSTWQNHVRNPKASGPLCLINSNLFTFFSASAKKSYFYWNLSFFFCYLNTYCKCSIYVLVFFEIQDPSCTNKLLKYNQKEF